MNVFTYYRLLALVAGLSLYASQPSVFGALEGKQYGFDGPFESVPSGPANPDSNLSGEIASGWGIISRGAVASLEKDEAIKRTGDASQRIEIRERGSGEVEFNHRFQGKIQKGERYRFSVWIKADRHTRASLFIRQTGAPYEVYARRSVEVSPEWQMFTLDGEVGNGDFRFIVAFNSKATFWVDDFAVERGTEGAFLSGPGNYFAVSSFEAGLSGGWSASVRGGTEIPKAARVETLEAAIAPDSESAFAGKASLVVPIAEGQGGVITSPPVSVSGGRRYVASIALKADAATEAQLILTGFSLKDVYAKQTVQVGSNWSRFEVSANVPPGATLRLGVRCFPDAATKLGVDAVQLEEGEIASAWQARYPAELALEAATDGAIFFYDQVPVLNIRVGGYVPKDARIVGEVESLLGAKVKMPPVSASAVTWEPVLPDGGKLGMFKLRASIIDADGKPVSAQAEKIFTVIPRPRKVTADRSYFGIHTSLQPKLIAIAVATGNKWTRLHDVSKSTLWPVVERVKGQFEFVDDGIKMARDAGLEIVGLLNGAPAWASASPRTEKGYFSVYNAPDTAEGLEGWKNYVRQTTTHYKEVITYWEVWNEPWSKGFFPGTAERYAHLLKAAYETAKEANPEIKIIGLNAAAHQQEWAHKVLREIGTKFYDIFSFHDYNPSFYQGEKNNAFRLAEMFTEIQKPYGDPKPLWNTEGGPGRVDSWYGEGEGLSPMAQISHIVRFEVSQIAAGVKHFFYYTLSHQLPESGAATFTLTEHDGSIRPALAARAVLASFIDGAEFVQRLAPASGVEGYQFKHADGSDIVILWSFDGQLHPVVLPDGSKAFDTFGNAMASTTVVEVGEPPLYFVSAND